LLPLISRAIRFAVSRRPFNVEPTGDLPGVQNELRQLARTRSTLLVIDDFHYLRGEPLAELTELLEGLAGEMIAILPLAQPVELAARPLLEQVRCEEIVLNNLEREALPSLWEQLFESPADQNVIDLLASTTHGNPLAIRSALRGAVRSGAIVFDPVADNWRMRVPLGALGGTFRRNVELLCEGMIAHLAEAERAAAMTLATLGEIVAVEAAEMVLPNAPEIIPILRSKGILAQSAAAAELVSGVEGAGTILTFTHKLLHDHLLAQTEENAGDLVRIIASNIPLHSIIPFQLLARSTRTADVTAEVATRAIMSALEASIALDRTTEWQRGAEAWNGAVGIKQVCANAFTDEEERALHAELLCTRLKLMRRPDDKPVFGPTVDQLLAITENSTSSKLLRYRLRAFSFQQALDRNNGAEHCHEVWERARALVIEHPALRAEFEYLQYLEEAARAMLYRGDNITLAEIERELVALGANPDAEETYRLFAKQAIALYCLELFETEEELEHRLQLLDEIEPYVEPGRRTAYIISKTVLSYTTGRMEAVVRDSNKSLPSFLEQNLPYNYYYGALIKHNAMASLGANFEEIVAEVESMASNAEKEIELFPRFALVALIEQALLRGEHDWLRNELARHGVPSNLRPETGIVLALELGMPRDTIADSAHMTGDRFGAFVELFIASQPDPGKLYTALTQALRAPVLRLSDVLEKRALLGAIPELSGRLGVAKLADAIAADMRDALIAALTWFDKRGLPSFAPPFKERFNHLLNEEERAAWRSRFASHERRLRQSSLQGGAEDNRMRLTMLGTIELHAPNGAPIPIRGSRLRTLVGLLVANQMLDEPLDYLEFSRVVAGTSDPDKARKTLNGVVFRLRDILGHEAIITQEETPKLNREMIEVDLLDASESLRDAAVAVREGSLARAQRRLLQVLAITRGSVPFPSLYDNFFEGTRERFETGIRMLLLKVAKELIAEGDARSAEELLRGGFSTMPGDEEMAELLCEALAALGKRTEAERVRMRMRDRSD
jgi:DNA-binding SARP family transcriptional activator